MDNVGLLVSGKVDAMDSQSKSGEVLVNDKVGVFLGNDELNKSRNGEGSVGERHDQRESGSYDSGECDEVVVRNVSSVEDLSPLIDGLLGEHVDKVVCDLDGGLVSRSDTQFSENRRFRKVAD